MFNDIEGRNPQYTATGDIDLEINHPVHGWIPFTASATDCEAHGRVIYADAVAGRYGEVQPYVPPPEPVS